MPRARRKDERPGEIIAAALASFAERGYAATKLEDVAAAAGISKGTIYLYFPTKEDLFRAVVRQAVLPNIEAAEAQFASHTGSCADLLRGLALRFLRLLDSDLTAVPKLVVAESGNFPTLAQFYADTVLRREAHERLPCAAPRGERREHVRRRLELEREAFATLLLDLLRVR